MKTRAKIVNIVDMKNYTIVEIDTDIPGIIAYPDGSYRKDYVRRFFTTNVMSAVYDIGRKIDIVSTWHNAGEECDGHVFKHDCYVHNFDYVD